MSRLTDDPRALPGAGDRVLVAGAGRSGSSAAAALARLGARVTIADDAAVREPEAGVRVAEGGLDPALAREADLVVASPGIRPDVPLLRAATEAGTPVWSELELGWRLARVPVLAVTGTNGKTTTTEMLAAALLAGGVDARAAGNIGTPLTDAAQSGAAALVTEVSSFQLHFAVSFAPRVAVLLNLAADHLDWHGSFDAYAADKARIFAAQTERDTAVVRDDPVCLAAASGVRSSVVPFGPSRRPAHGAGVENGAIVVPQGIVARVGALKVAGDAMLSDAVAAAAAAAAFGVPLEAIATALSSFQPAPHRFEVVAEAAGVRYVNDSKATNPHATLAALRGLEHVVLIAGGRNKGLDLGELRAAAPVLRGVVAIGEAAPDVAAAFTGTAVVRAKSMDEAVEAARELAEPGDTILLSPACASFDMFADYAARGEAFRAAVKRIIHHERGEEVR